MTAPTRPPGSSPTAPVSAEDSGPARGRGSPAALSANRANRRRNPLSGYRIRTRNQLIWLGTLLVFVVRIIGTVPRVMIHHRREVYRLLGEVTFGGGILAVATSTVLVVAILSASLGVQIGLEGYQGLQIIGLGPLAGFLSAFGNTRELAPLITAFGLAAQMGCKFTAQLGAMRVTEEIDALEVMAIPSLPYLITTRMIAALVATVPLYLLALSGSYLATQLTVVAVAHQGSGTYLHYFEEFLTERDIVLSVAKVVVFAVLVTIIHCYYGFTATGGPEGVGRAAGRAIRASIVTIAFGDMLMTLLFYGTSSGVKIYRMSAATAIVDRAAHVQESPRALQVLGIVLVAGIIGVIVGILALFTGQFTSYVAVRAVIAGSGNAVAKGNEVVYRGVTVGTVSSNGTIAANHDVVVDLHLIPYRVRSIPANVTVTVDPVTIFGTEYVILEPPKVASAARLTSGATLQAAVGASGANVQAAFTSLDQILSSLHPAQLDAALTALATALQGQGTGLGHTLDTVDTYLKTMLPHFPTLEADLALLAPVANQVATSAPQLVGSLSNLTTIAKTITAEPGRVQKFVAGGTGLANQLDAVLAPTQQPLEEILAAAGPFLKDVSQSPTLLARTLSGLSAWATSWATAEENGPYLSFSASVPVANATDLVFAALNAPGSAGPTGYAAQALGTDKVDPAPYTSSAGGVDATSERIDPALITPAEQRDLASVDAGLDGGRAPASPAVASLLLSPLLGQVVMPS